MTEASRQQVAPPSRLKRFLTRLGVFLLIVALLAGLAWIFRVPLLKTVGAIWIVETEEFERVDAIIIPGGGVATRPFGAAELYHDGKSDRLVIFHVEKSPDQELGVTPSQQERTLQILDRLEVPESAIVTIGDGVDSTWDEVEATRDWCADNDIRSLAVMTEIMPSRRQRWAFQHGLREQELDLHVVALDAYQYEADTWWTHERGVVDFQTEVLKYIYYRVMY